MTHSANLFVVLMHTCQEGGWSGQHQSPPPPPVVMEDLRASKPNILIVFGDDVGYADLSCFGHPTARTPNLDKMAAEGAKLVQYLSAANICSPSRGSLLTGRLYGRLGIWPGTFPPSAVGGLQTNETTIARALQRVGYTSGMVGKVSTGRPASVALRPKCSSIHLQSCRPQPRIDLSCIG